MSSKIDLHLHSYFSDGRQSPEEVFDMAKQNGVEVVSLTDHDSTRSFERAKACANTLDLRYIPGVEITTNYKGGILHILGYGFNVGDVGLQSIFSTLSDNRKRMVVHQVEIINERLEAADRPEQKIHLDSFIESQNEYFNRWKLVDYLLEKQTVSNREEALKLAQGIRVAVDQVLPDTAIELVHKAGGIAVLAHPFGPKISFKIVNRDVIEQEKVITLLKELGLDGIECYQPSHGGEDTVRALDMAKKYSLMVVAGTDWHGPIEMTGEGIKEYIPYYADRPGGLNVPEAAQQKMIEAFSNI